MPRNDLFVLLTIFFVIPILLVVYAANFIIGWSLAQIIRLNESLIHRCENYWQTYVCYLNECAS